MPPKLLFFSGKKKGTKKVDIYEEALFTALMNNAVLSQLIPRSFSYYYANSLNVGDNGFHHYRESPSLQLSDLLG